MKKAWLIAGVFVIIVASLLVVANYTAENGTNPENLEDIIIAKDSELFLVEDHDEVTVPILIYHNIREVTFADSAYDQQFIISPEGFEKQLAFLKDNNFNTISFDDLFDFLESGTQLPDKPVILTFDDGSRNQYRSAFPLLKEFGFTGTFFVFTNAMDRNDNYMTWAELREMTDAGMTIGSHTRLHPYLNGGHSEEVLTAEIAGSKKDLEENLDIEVNYFSYPFGEYDQNIIEKIKEAGYRGARDILHGMLHDLDNRYTLNAYFVPTSFEGFERLLR